MIKCIYLVKYLDVQYIDRLNSFDYISIHLGRFVSITLHVTCNVIDEHEQWTLHVHQL